MGIIIVNHNDRTGLINLLDCLAAQTYPTRLLEIAIADNGSIDGSARDMRWLASEWNGTVFAKIHVIALGENQGAPKALNAALNQLSYHCRSILKLDSDVLLQPDCLQSLLNRLRAPAPAEPQTLHGPSASHAETLPTGAVGGREYSQLDPDVLLSIGIHLTGPELRPQFPALTDPAVIARLKQTGVLPVTAPPGACTLYDAALFRALGGLDESFFVYYDDIDLGLRTRLLGRACLFEPRAVYRHRKSATTGARTSSPFHRFHEARSSLLFGRKYAGATAGESARFARAWNVRSNLRFLLTGHPLISLAGWRGLFAAQQAPVASTPADLAWTRSGP